MKQIYDKFFIKRFLNHECSKQERDDFLDWLDRSGRQEGPSWMQEIWEASPGKKEKLVLGAEERVLRHILDEIGDSTPVSKDNQRYDDKIRQPRRTFWQLYPLVRYASVILVVLIPLIIYRSIMYQDAIPEPIAYLEKMTHNGQHLTFVLDDGTRITLNSNSRLSYPAQFSDSSRVVELHGEAFFDVAKDSKRPFRVVTGAISTTALGTSFNIHYSEDRSISEISLITGSVSVEMDLDLDGKENVRLSPGEQLLYRFEEDSFETRSFDPLEVAGWKDGVIYFKEASIEDIIGQLEVWYDVKIELADYGNRIDEMDWTYTGKFENQTLENVLLGISYVKGFSFEIHDKNVKLLFN